MNKIDLIITTRNRNEKLKEVLDSIPDLDYLNVKIIYDGPQVFLNYRRKNFVQYFMKEQKGLVYCRNKLIESCCDGVLYTTDNVFFDAGAIEKVFALYNATFNDDGVVAFNQLGEHKPAGVALVGKQFIKRFPENKLFNPAYKHLSVHELEIVATRYKKFVVAKDAFVYHFAQNMSLGGPDETQKESELFIKEDRKLMLIRKQRSQVWGL